MSEPQEFPEWAGQPPTRPDIPGELASIGQRFLARLLDVVVLAIPTVIVAAPLFARIGREMTNRDLPSDPTEIQRRLSGSFLRFTLLALLLSALYEVVLTATRGQTLGKMALRIRVVRADGGLPDWGPAAVRWVVPAIPGLLNRLPVIGSLMGLVTLLIYLWAIWDDRKQGLHDKSAGTFVVRVPEG